MRFPMKLAITRSLLFVLVGMLLPVPAGAQSDPEDPYGEAVRIGVQEFGHGNYAESLAAMRRAHSIDPNARTLRGMGLAAFELGDYVDALEYLQGALEHPRKPLTPDMREQVEALIRRAEANVATVVLRVTPQDARVRVDDGPPKPLKEGGALRLNLGTHTVELRAEGHQSQRLRLELVGGEKPELEVELQPQQPSRPVAPPVAPPAPAPDSKRIWGQVLLGLSGAALAGGLAAIGVRQAAVTKYNSNACEPVRSVECPGVADRANASEAAAIALLAAGGALGATGTALLWRSRRQAKAQRAASLSCRLGLGATCRLRF